MTKRLRGRPVCRHCGKVITRRPRNARHCDDNCRQEKYAQLRRERQRERKKGKAREPFPERRDGCWWIPGPCGNPKCGKTDFPARRFDAEHCSPKCRAAAWRASHPS